MWIPLWDLILRIAILWGLYWSPLIYGNTATEEEDRPIVRVILTY